MIICNTCGAVFETPKISKTMGGDIGEPWETCPVCGSDYLDDAKYCEVCDNWYAETVPFASKNCCHNCAKLASGDKKICLDFLKHENLEREFFVEYFLESECERASKELIQIAREFWEKSDRADLLSEYVLECDDFGVYLERVMGSGKRNLLV